MSEQLDRFAGSILGQALGDGLGAPLEGLPSGHIFQMFGSAQEVLAAPPVKKLRYTDDTEMLIGVAESLIEFGEIVSDSLAKRFAENYHPERGYGPGATRILEGMLAGEDVSELVQTIFPGGSLGNGAAMRVAPVGLLFHHDLEAVAQQARLSALPTHVHPLGIEGAVLLATAVALAVRLPPSSGQRFDRQAMYRQLLPLAEHEEFRWALTTASRLRLSDSLSSLGSDLQAHRSVVTAIACFATNAHSYEDTVATAINLGHDVDTVAAMAGAISGAYLGTAGLPSRLLNMLEDGPRGRTYLAQLAEKLSQRWQKLQEQQ